MGNALDGCSHVQQEAPEIVTGDSSPTEAESRRRLTAVELERIAKHSSMQKLRKIQSQHPFLKQPTHMLYDWVRTCEEAMKESDDAKAEDALAHLAQGLEQEEKTLTAAFYLFAPPESDCLSHTEVQRMLEYLGFPSSKSDVDAVLRAVDHDGDKTMNLSEFQRYVGRMGGSFQLFEVRRQQMAAKHGAGGGAVADYDEKMLVQDLKAAGIVEQEQAYWKLVLPRFQEEFIEAARLVECQRAAVRHIRSLAKNNHEQNLPELQRRCKTMGYSDNDLWMTLAYIRELAPIIVHLNLTKMMNYLESDTHYRNQFETASSGGLLKPQVRERWERDLFGGCYDKAKGFERCKYGVLNAMNDYRGVVKCAQYGDSYFVLKDCRLRCTFSPEDSANLKANRLAVLDYYAHVLNEYSNDELQETIKIAKSGEAAVLGDSSKVGNMKYKETQVHGEIRFDKHVDRLVAHERHRKDPKEAKRLEGIAKKHGWKFSWMDHEQKRMQEEEKAKLGEEAWKVKLKAIMEKGAPDVEGVPKGYCRKGCCRKVQPGKTSRGNSFTTCCRGCALGFGHDLTCNNIDPELVKPGMCLNGCGKPVNPGVSSTGRPFLTCCKGCARGVHDPICGLGNDYKPGTCKFGCGCKVAPAANGRKFDTCCVKCAKTSGEEHDARCLGPLEE
eukprot:CAMPEP_0206438876 /NCGR_PEP_ID=MMETSP0324_2-20121206/11892_1 /ASSEMBLY_ACC=CAM_ASM_000836 /TAXON_ID=2866 /ORGANISM="Crypthecodinium cohnii, Strain Seligo" /LENGTH=667 /DNA_ID=CAMNT_0053906421 /DNA_START=197 /DNA_END=2200 /DNA_ORIENTATION=-